MDYYGPRPFLSKFFFKDIRKQFNKPLKAIYFPKNHQIWLKYTCFYIMSVIPVAEIGPFPAAAAVL